jgi:hypothetical protein
MRASFAISDAAPDTFEVYWAWWGREEYRLNGNVIGRFWSLSLAGERRFEAAGHIVRIAFAVRGKDYVGRAYVDDEVRVPELYPNLRARGRRRVSLKSRLKTAAVWFIIGLVGTYLYLTITRG